MQLIWLSLWLNQHRSLAFLNLESNVSIDQGDRNGPFLRFATVHFRDEAARTPMFAMGAKADVS